MVDLEEVVVEAGEEVGFFLQVVVDKVEVMVLLGMQVLVPVAEEVVIQPMNLESVV